MLFINYVNRDLGDKNDRFWQKCLDGPRNHRVKGIKVKNCDNERITNSGRTVNVEHIRPWETCGRALETAAMKRKMTQTTEVGEGA